jgi:poly(3-hydroxybutyrate) depolymerase
MIGGGPFWPPRAIWCCAQITEAVCAYPSPANDNIVENVIDNGETKTSVGRMDWADIESMIDKAVAQKFADPGRLGIAGHNQCAFLAAWGCTRPNSRFKAGVICGGVSDWGALCLTSDIPDLEVGPSPSV